MPYKDDETRRRRRRELYQLNKQRYQDRHKTWYERNKEKVKAKVRKWAQENRERRKEIVRNSDKRRAKEKYESVKDWRSRNPDKQRATQRRYMRSHPDRVRLKSARRRARKRRAVPPWFGELDRLVEREAADLARRRTVLTGFAWHIDHIIPLAGERVCGLHVWNNLQVIPGHVNTRKRNRYEP